MTDLEYRYDRMILALISLMNKFYNETLSKL